MKENKENEIDFDEYGLGELQTLIANGEIKNEDVVDYYNNEWWSDEG
tara:strand:- start:685 stop:825 length:141 start_codon:yes stop_codon:yes gene_type:complete